MMERRELFHILGVGAAASAWGAPGTALRYLTQPEFETLDRLCEMLIPADDSGPGGHDAGVARYVDLILQYSDSASRDRWRSGLGAVESYARAEFGKRFVDCTVVEQGRVMDKMASGESQPESEMDKFFVLLKGTAIQGFSLSENGRKALGYRGDAAVHSFSGCTHPEHQRM
jgi:hypothetical protein